MNNEHLLVEERSADIGQFMVGRLLPFRRKRQVGPFTFIDHMGPAQLGAGKYVDVDQHPHIGLSTLTYLLEGEIEHRDSTGAHQIIRPGDVGFMTAGKGVAHTERTPKRARTGASMTMHGYQVWVAMPKEKEEMEPRFDFVAAKALPRWKEGDLEMTLVAGEGYGRKSPLPVHSPLFMIHAKASCDTVLDIAGELEGEIAIVVVRGKVHVDKQEVNAGQMLISKTEATCSLRVAADAELLLFGGEAFPEERFLHWNFVSHSKERLAKAAEDWNAKRFPKVDGDNTYISLPNIG